MNSIRSIYIPHVEEGITAEYIMDVIYSNGIATVSRITLLPNISSNKYSGNTYMEAYIDIDSWHETETAYKFIQQLRKSPEETRFVHSGDKWWLVEVNRSPWVTTCSLFEKETTVNWLVCTDVYEIMCNLDAAFQMARTVLFEKIMDHIEDEEDWLSIEKSLSEEKTYQQLEYDLCL
jgi:hypothetical protein